MAAPPDDIDSAFGADAPIARAFLQAIEEDTIRETAFPASFFQNLTGNLAQQGVLRQHFSPEFRDIVAEDLPKGASADAFQTDLLNTAKSEYQVAITHNEFISALSQAARMALVSQFLQHTKRLMTIFEYGRIYTALTHSGTPLASSVFDKLYAETAKYGITDQIYTELAKYRQGRVHVRRFYGRMTEQGATNQSMDMFAHAVAGSLFPFPSALPEELVPFCDKFHAVRDFLLNVNKLNAVTELPSEFIIKSCALIAALTDAQYKMLHIFVPPQARGAFAFYADATKPTDNSSVNGALLFGVHPKLAAFYEALRAGADVTIDDLDGVMYTAILQRFAQEEEDPAPARARLAALVQAKTKKENGLLFAQAIPQSFPHGDAQLKQTVVDAIVTINLQAGGEEDLSTLARLFGELEPFDVANACDRLSGHHPPRNLRLNYLHYLYDSNKDMAFSEFCAYCPIDVILQLTYALRWMDAFYARGRVLSETRRALFFNSLLLRYFRTQIHLEADVIDEWRAVRERFLGIEDIKKKVAEIDSFLQPSTPLAIPDSPLTVQPTRDLVPLLDLNAAQGFDNVYPILVPYNSPEMKGATLYGTDKVKGYDSIFITKHDEAVKITEAWDTPPTLAVHIDRTVSPPQLIILPATLEYFRFRYHHATRRPGKDGDVERDYLHPGQGSPSIIPARPRPRQLIVVESTSPAKLPPIAFMGSEHVSKDFVKLLFSEDFSAERAVERYAGFIRSLTPAQDAQLRIDLKHRAYRLDLVVDELGMTDQGLSRNDASMILYLIRGEFDPIDITVNHYEFLSTLTASQREWFRSRAPSETHNFNMVFYYTRVGFLLTQFAFAAPFPAETRLPLVVTYGLLDEFDVTLRDAASTIATVAQFYHEMGRLHVKARALIRFPEIIFNQDLDRGMLPAELPAFCFLMEAVDEFFLDAHKLLDPDSATQLRFLLPHAAMLSQLNRAQFAMLLFVLPPPLRPKVARAAAAVHKPHVVGAVDSRVVATLEKKIVEGSATYQDCAVLTQDTYDAVKARLLTPAAVAFFVQILHQKVDSEIRELLENLMQALHGGPAQFVRQLNESGFRDEQLYLDVVAPLDDSDFFAVTDRIAKSDERRQLRVWCAMRHWPENIAQFLDVCRQLPVEDVVAVANLIKEIDLRLLPENDERLVLRGVVLFAFAALARKGMIETGEWSEKWEKFKAIALAIGDEKDRKKVALIESLIRQPQSPDILTTTTVPPGSIEALEEAVSPIPEQVLPDPAAGPVVFLKDFLAYVKRNCPTLEPKAPQICDVLDINDALLDEYTQVYKKAASMDDTGVFNDLLDKQGAVAIVALLRAHLPLVCVWGNESIEYWLLRLVSLLLFFPVTLIFNIVFNGCQRNRSHTPFFHCMQANNPFLYKARLLIPAAVRSRPTSTNPVDNLYRSTLERQELPIDDGDISLCSDTSAWFSFKKPRVSVLEQSVFARRQFTRESDPEKKYTWPDLESPTLSQLWNFVQDLDLWWWQRFQLNPAALLDVRVTEMLRLSICNAGALWVPDLFSPAQPPSLSSLVLYHAANRSDMLADWLTQNRDAFPEPERDYAQFITKILIPFFSDKSINNVFSLFLLPIATFACRSASLAAYLVSAEEALKSVSGTYWIGRHRVMNPTTHKPREEKETFPAYIAPYFSYFSIDESVLSRLGSGFYQHRLHTPNAQNVTVPPSELKYLSAQNPNQWFDSAAVYMHWKEMGKNEKKRQGRIINWLVPRNTPTEAAQVQYSAQLVRCYLYDDGVVQALERNIREGSDAYNILQILHGQPAPADASELVNLFASQLPRPAQSKRAAEEPLELLQPPSIRGVLELGSFKRAVSDMMTSARLYGTPYFVWQRMLQIFEEGRPNSGVAMLAGQSLDPTSDWLTAFDERIGDAQREFNTIVSKEMLLHFFGNTSDDVFDVFMSQIVGRMLQRLEDWERLKALGKEAWTSRNAYREMKDAIRYFTTPDEVYGSKAFTKEKIKFPDRSESTMKEAMDKLLKSLDDVSYLPTVREYVHRLLYIMFKLNQHVRFQAYASNYDLNMHLIALLCFYCKNLTEGVIGHSVFVLTGREPPDSVGFKTPFAEPAAAPSDVPMPPAPEQAVLTTPEPAGYAPAQTPVPTGYAASPTLPTVFTTVAESQSPLFSEASASPVAQGTPEESPHQFLFSTTQPFATSPLTSLSGYPLESQTVLEYPFGPPLSQETSLSYGVPPTPGTIQHAAEYSSSTQPPPPSPTVTAPAVKPSPKTPPSSLSIAVPQRSPGELSPSPPPPSPLSYSEYPRRPETTDITLEEDLAFLSENY